MLPIPYDTETPPATEEEADMGGESWSVTAGKPCDSCKASPAAMFCRADSAFLCPACDGEIHAANKLASRHARVWLCDVCEKAPATVTCRADAAALCPACDRDIHSANPLARRHHRHPIVPFYDAPAGRPLSGPPGDEFSEEEAEAASWILPDEPAAGPDPEPGSPGYESAEYLFGDPDPYPDLDLDLIPGGERKQQQQQQAAEQRKQCAASSADGVVPVGGAGGYCPGQYPGPVVDGYPTYELEYPRPKPFLYNFTSQAISQSVSSSSMDVGVVPDHNATSDVSNTFAKSEATPTPTPTRVSGMDREARVLRYKEKRKNRRFEKTIRYASRKAYAETRPRIKGRFAKRSELEVDSLLTTDASYGVVPSF